MITYSIVEARRVAESHKLDVYHKELILWLCDKVEAKDKQLGENKRK